MPDLATDILRATAEITIEAAAGTDRPAKVIVAAYNGGLMKPPGWPELAIELSGVELPESVALLADHKSELSGIVGHGRPTVRDGRRLVIEGTLSDATEAGRQVRDLAKSGFPFQASIGLKPTGKTKIAAGETVNVNGSPLKSPRGFVHIQAGILQEVSILPLGADSTTSVSVASKQGDNMPDEIDELTPEQIERERVASILKIQANYEGEQIHHIAARAVEEGWNVQQAELEMLRAAKPIGPPNVHAIGRGNHSPQQGGRADYIEASVLRMAGLQDVALEAYGEQALDRSETINSLVDVCAESLRLEGRHVPRGSDQIIKASFSTASLPTVLENTTGRSMIQPFIDTTSRWRVFATIKSAANFKQQKSARPSSFETLEELGAGGEIKHSDIAEDGAYTWSVDTFARIIGITRHTIINDDLGFVSEFGPLLGQAAGRSLNDLIWSTIMGGESAGFFASGNNNLLEAASDMDLASLQAAVTAMRKQVDTRGYNIDNTPVALAVPPDIEADARSVLNSTEIVSGNTTNQPNGNPMFNIVPNLIPEARLSNTDRFTGASATAWYLFAGPMSHAVIVGFLRGMQTPTVEVQQADFNKLGIQLRVYFDYGVALGDSRGALKATGAGS